MKARLIIAIGARRSIKMGKLRPPIKRHNKLASHGIDALLLSGYQLSKFFRLFLTIETDLLLETDRIFRIYRERIVDSRFDQLIAKSIALLNKRFNPGADTPVGEQLFYLLY